LAQVILAIFIIADLLAVRLGEIFCTSRTGIMHSAHAAARRLRGAVAGTLARAPRQGSVRHVPAPVAAVSAASRLSRQHFPSACCLALCPCGRGVQRAPADRRHMNTQGRGKGSLVQAVFGEDEQADTERRDHAASPGSGHQSGAGRTQGGSASGRGTAAQDSGVELYCTGLPVSWNREELRQLFEPFGHVTSVQVPQQTVHLQDGLTP
jgi:hypothetical protein